MSDIIRCFWGESKKIAFPYASERRSKDYFGMLCTQKKRIPNDQSNWPEVERSTYILPQFLTQITRTLSPALSIAIGNKTYVFPLVLHRIVVHIQEAKEILSYPDNWDDEGAEATDESTFIKAADFLRSYAIFIERNYGVTLATPYMDILRDGSISIHWETKRGLMIIIFKKTSAEKAYFFAERLADKVEIKSAVIVGAEPDEILAQWMKTYLS